MYEIGDKIVFPMHGAGTVTDIVEREILGQTGLYYIFTMPVSNMEISIPVDSVDQIGIRDVMSRQDSEKVMEILHASPSKMPGNWSQRFRENMAGLKTGDPFEIAEVVRNLQTREMEQGLSASEKKMLTASKRMLVSELVINGVMSVDEARTMIDDAIGAEESSDEA